MGTTDTTQDRDATRELRGLDPDDVVAEYHRRGLDGLSDAALVDAAAGVIDGRLIDPPDSFLLHAPLELLARASLLQHCSPSVREAARQRLVWVAARFERDGRPADPAGVGTEPADEDDAVRRLAAAIRAGELDDAGAAGRWLGRNVEAQRLPALIGDLLVPSLAAAAHGPIFLHLLPRIASRSARAGAMLGNLAREVAREPTLRLTWIDGAAPAPVPSDDALDAALAAVPVVGVPGSTFIHPLMRQAEASGLAPEVGRALGPDPLADARALLRAATESMLLDDPGHAPYGWSHCLTLPQAVLSIAPTLRDPRAALMVATTHVVGFRAALGAAPLRELRVGHEHVTGATHRPTDVVDQAAVHPDAHLAKYVMACIDAARTDPGAARQHLAAADHLARWWQARPSGDDPITAAVTAS